MANQLEKKQLEQINNIGNLNEGFFSNALVRVLFTRKAKKAFKQIGKSIKKNPEIAAAIVDLKNTTDNLNDLITNYCKKWPTDPQCD